MYVSYDLLGKYVQRNWNLLRHKVITQMYRGIFKFGCHADGFLTAMFQFLNFSQLENEDFLKKKTSQLL